MPGILIENKVKLEEVVSTFFMLLLLAIVSIGIEISLHGFNLPNKKLTYYATSEADFKKLKRQKTNVEYKIKKEEDPQLYV